MKGGLASSFFLCAQGARIVYEAWDLYAREEGRASSPPPFKAHSLWDELRVV